MFDNDGTLWCEKPMPIELGFILRRLAEMAEHDPTLRDRQPWKAAHEKDYGWLGDAMTKHYQGDDSEVRVLIGGLLQAFAGRVEERTRTRRTHSAARRSTRRSIARYHDCGYAPMVELLRLLEAKRVHELHRLGRRPGLHAADHRRPVRHPAASA